MAPLLSDQGRVARNGGSVALRERLAVLFEEMRRTNAEIALLWEIYERAKERERCGAQSQMRLL